MTSPFIDVVIAVVVVVVIICTCSCSSFILIVVVVLPSPPLPSFFFCRARFNDFIPHSRGECFDF